MNSQPWTYKTTETWGNKWTLCNLLTKIQQIFCSELCSSVHFLLFIHGWVMEAKRPVGKRSSTVILSSAAWVYPNVFQGQRQYRMCLGSFGSTTGSPPSGIYMENLQKEALGRILDGCFGYTVKCSLHPLFIGRCGCWYSTGNTNSALWISIWIV